jgi:diketogulonate reductase-like aldo/keto reductase
MTTPNRTTTFPSGTVIPALGQGTWYLGEDRRRHDDELAALRTGIDIGLTAIDTAEMYGDGASELLVGEAIAGRRDDVFLISKVLPNHASTAGTRRACEASLRRLGTDHLDLYLLHWRGGIPLAETVDAFEGLVRGGLIRGWGVSNFDTDDLDELLEVPGGERVQTNQVLYNLARRGPEFDLLPWCRERGIPLMSYSPVDHGRLLQHPVVEAVARAKGLTTAQLAIAWVLRLAPEMCAMVKAGDRDHVQQNRAAVDVDFSAAELAQLDLVLPPPTRKISLEML